MIYKNELTVLFNVFGYDGEMISGPYPHYIRIPEEMIETNLEDFIISSEHIRGYLKSIARTDEDLSNGLIRAVVMQTHIKLAVRTEQFNLSTSSPKLKTFVRTRESHPKSILNNLLREYNFNPLDEDMDWGQFRNIAVNKLVDAGMTIHQIRLVVGKDEI